MITQALITYGSGAGLTTVVLGMRAAVLADAGRGGEILPFAESVALIILWPIALLWAVVYGTYGIATKGVDRALPDADSAKNLRHVSRKQAGMLALERERVRLARELNDEHERMNRIILGLAPDASPAKLESSRIYESREWE